MSNLLVGADPEVALIDGATGNLKSAIGVVKGTKDNKIDLGNGNKLFYDNVLAEMNIRPGEDAEDLVYSIQSALRSLARTVRPYRPVLMASATYPVSECKHPDALVFGCEPEFCAYEMSIVQAPECKTTFRSAGGHIHLGYRSEKWPLMAPTDEDGGLARAWGRVWVIRMMDLFMGIPSLWIDQDPSSPARRKLYGKAGTHRPKEEYGVEYRATSNFWLRSPDTVRLVYNISKFVVDFVANDRHKELWPNDTCSYDIDGLRDAINNSNKEKASVFLNGLVKKHMPNNLYTELLLACEPVTSNFYDVWGI